MVEKPSVELFDTMVNAIRGQTVAAALVELLVRRGTITRTDAAALYTDVAKELSEGITKPHFVIPARTAAGAARHLALFYATEAPPPDRNN